MYTVRNFKTKADVKRALMAGEQIHIYQPNGDITGSRAPENGKVYLEGPHYPQPHKWYAEAWIENGVVVKVR